MERLSRVVGPIATNVHVLADPRTREAIAIDTATPSLAWIADELAARDWTLKLIVSTHGHWDHIGDNAARRRRTRAPTSPSTRSTGSGSSDPRAAVRAVRDPAVRAGRRAGRGRRDPLRRASGCGSSTRPGHTEGSVCLLAEDDGLLFSGDTLFAGGWGGSTCPAATPDAMVASLARLTGLEDPIGVFPGHGAATTIGRERAWLELVRDGGRLFA